MKPAKEHENRKCEAVKNLFFLKTSKTGSQTLMGIIHRFGIKYGLSFLLGGFSQIDIQSEVWIFWKPLKGESNNGAVANLQRPLTRGSAQNFLEILMANKRSKIRKNRNFKVMKSELLDREEFTYEIQYINSTYEIRKKSSGFCYDTRL